MTKPDFSKCPIVVSRRVWRMEKSFFGRAPLSLSSFPGRLGVIGKRNFRRGRACYVGCHHFRFGWIIIASSPAQKHLELKCFRNSFEVSPLFLTSFLAANWQRKLRLEFKPPSGGPNYSNRIENGNIFLSRGSEADGFFLIRSLFPANGGKLFKLYNWQVTMSRRIIFRIEDN